jgi:glycosyltransferase involved in cell wall biosynthesis
MILMGSVLFIGPRLLAGIGQVTNRYAEFLRSQGFETEYLEIGHSPLKQEYDAGFAFVLPIEHQLEIIDKYALLCKKMTYMTICETETVNPVYGILQKYKKLYVASEFCKRVFERQFPETQWEVLRLLAYEKPQRAPAEGTPYTFYTIGNMADPRKNLRGLVEAFQMCNFGDQARLVLKATCIQPFQLGLPNVVVINGLLPDEMIDKIHGSCHCYINCSHSEGVGMGAVEAALMSKPVIITDYGGLKEYVKTPWVVPCTLGPIGFDDFLFTKDLQWGHPSTEVLAQHMRDCFEKRVSSWDHSHTKALMADLCSSLSQRLLRASEPLPASPA